MKTSPATLENIKTKYPAAFAALPEGWRFLNIGEMAVKGDKYWAFGDGPFKESDEWNTWDLIESIHFPHIRRIRENKAEIVDAIPGLVWPAEVKKEGKAEGLIYVGRGKSEGISGLTGHKVFSFSVWGEYESCSHCYSGNGLSYHYFVPKDHPILAQYKPKSREKTKAELTAENASLKTENEALKARILKLEKVIAEIKTAANSA